MAWSGLTGYILCCQLNNFMANVGYIFWFNTACANKDFLLSYYSMSKRYVEILQESYWQKGQVHFLKKHQKKTCWLERAQFLPSLPNTTQPFAPTTTPQPWKGGISPSTFQNLSCLLFILLLLLNFTCPRSSRPKTLYHDSSLRGATRTAWSRQDTSTALRLELKPCPTFQRLDPPSTNSTAARPGITITRKKRISFVT